MTEISPADTVVVACASPGSSERIVGLLSDAGFSVVGPVDTARMALALAAQTPFSLAVVGSKLAGRRDGATLAKELMTTWGVRSIMVDGEADDADWSADCDLSAQVRKALSQDELTA